MADRFELTDKVAVLDQETGLMWQREASAEQMVWGDGAAYIEHLNTTGFAGFSDWRVPTRDELAGLIIRGAPDGVELEGVPAGAILRTISFRVVLDRS